MNLASIPSPSEGVWHLGPLPLRAYALAIILGIIVAIWVGERRFVARGGRPGTVSDVAVWAIPFGLIGARAYHVATNPEFYFGDGKDPIQALYVWEGGLGIWGAIAFGALGAYLGCRYSGVKFTSYIDAVAPGIVLAQAIGRWGNYFNQELFGEPTDRPWGIEIDLANRPEGFLEYPVFHPTFLYESLWCLGVALVVILADRRWRLGRGRVFALYVAVYTAGRAWIEDLRIDDAHEFGPFRLNVWVAIAIFVLAVAYFVVVGRMRPGREESVRRDGAVGDEVEADSEAAESVAGDDAEGGEAAGGDDAEGEAAEDAVDAADRDEEGDGARQASERSGGERAEGDGSDDAADGDDRDSDKADEPKASDDADAEADDEEDASAAEPEADAQPGSEDAESDVDEAAPSAGDPEADAETASEDGESDDGPGEQQVR